MTQKGTESVSTRVLSLRHTTPTSQPSMLLVAGSGVFTCTAGGSSQTPVALVCWGGGGGCSWGYHISQSCWVPDSSVQLSPPSTNFIAGLGFCSLQPKPQPSPTSLTQEGLLRDKPEFAALLMHKAKGNGLAGWPAFILQTELWYSSSPTGK